ncbi:MAG: glutathione S-transferase family protein [Solirubrobacterales bacterium]
MADYRLFWSPGTCARVPFVALEEIGCPYAVTVVDKAAKGRPDYIAMNPKGKVPTLLADGRAVTENPAIQLFLARRHPEAGLLPAGPAEELEALELMSWFAAGIHPAITRQRYPQLFSEEPAAWASIRVRARVQLEEAFTILERRLRHGGWLFDAWSVVDVYLLWLWFRATGSGMDGTEFPACADLARRCEARPSVAKVLDREEREFDLLLAQGRAPASSPPFQVGRAPTF